MKKNILLFLFIIACIYSFVAIKIHKDFQTFAWDLGFFDQLIWQASKFKPSYSTIGKVNLLGDHFQPVLYLLVPFYWIWSDVKVLLIAQAFLVVFAGYPLFLLTGEVLANKFASWVIVFSYLFFTSTQFTVLNEFHQSAFTPLFLGLLFWFHHKKKNFGFWLTILALLMVKEELTLLVAAIGLMLILAGEKRKGITTFFIGIFSFVFLVYFLIPAISITGEYIHFGYGEAGGRPEQVLTKIISSPSFLVKSLISPSVKLKTIFSSFFSFAFLPFFSPIHLLPIFQQFFVRFLDYSSFHRWTNLNHYAIPLSPLMAVASIYGIKNLVEKLQKFKIATKKQVIKFSSLILLLFVFLQDYLDHGPLNSLAKKQFWQIYPWILDNQKVIAKIPANVSVAAQNSLVPHLSQRNEIYLLPEVFSAEYIVVDLEDGPNKYSPLDLQQTKKIVKKLIESGEYGFLFQQGKALILKRKNET